MQHCANCGAASAPDAVYCSRCGGALRADAPAGAAPAAAPGPPSGGGSGKTAVWVAAGCGCLFVGVIVVGILAAIAIPKFAKVSKQAKEAEAAPVLEQIVALELAHRDQHGRFTENLHDPQRPDHLAGWAAPAARYYTFWVSRATEDELCVSAELSDLGAASDLSTFSMDRAMTLHAGPDCSSPAQGGAWDGGGEAVVDTAEYAY